MFRQSSYVMLSSLLVFSACQPSTPSHDGPSQKPAAQAPAPTTESAEYDAKLAKLEKETQELTSLILAYQNSQTPETQETASIESAPLLAASTTPPQKNEPPAPVITPSARGCPKENGFTMMAEFLYWRAFEDNLFSTISSTQFSSTRGIAKFVHLQPGFKPGFRIGAGYNCTYDDWWVDAQYTWYYSHKNVFASNPTTNISPGLIPLIFKDNIDNGIIIGSDLHAHWTLHYNVVDLELGRDFHISQYLDLNPFASIRGAWIRQVVEQTFNYATLLQIGSPVISVTANAKQKQKFWGVGPRLGLNTHWLFGNSGCGLFLNGNGSLLYSNYSPLFHYVINSQPDNAPVADTTLHDVSKRISANAELFLGLDYGNCWQDWFYFNVCVGYMANYWWSQNQMLNISNFVRTGDLLLHGFDVSLDFAF